ncbi:MAG TPA: AraC family transcriptional regulator [Polyangiaceae bacterium]|jgi:AraC-like DNA-binding protein
MLTFTVQRHPRLAVARFAGERPLIRAIPEHFATTMHLDGRSTWACGGAEWSAAAGDVSLKVPGEVVIQRAREGRLGFQVVLFEDALIDEAREALERPILEPRTFAFDRGDPRARPLVALHHHFLNDEPAEALEQATCEAVHALVDAVYVSRAESTARRRRFSAAVTRARALLDERYTETVGLDELAAHARLDKFRLCRAFREQVGLPPHAYVTHRRVARAQDLLARGVPQAEVATRVGFYDQSLLHRHFKQILRVTPGAWARAARGGTN